MTANTELTDLRNRREEIRRFTERLLLTVRARGRETLRPGEQARYEHALADMEALTESINEISGELQRRSAIDANPTLARLRAKTGAALTRRGGARSAGAFSPMSFDPQEMHHAHARLAAGESVVLETRDPGFASADSLLPAQLFPIPTFPPALATRTSLGPNRAATSSRNAR